LIRDSSLLIYPNNPRWWTSRLPDSGTGRAGWRGRRQEEGVSSPRNVEQAGGAQLYRRMVRACLRSCSLV